jgi:hypothetical protein
MNTTAPVVLITDFLIISKILNSLGNSLQLPGCISDFITELSYFTNNFLIITIVAITHTWSTSTCSCSWSTAAHHSAHHLCKWITTAATAATAATHATHPAWGAAWTTAATTHHLIRLRSLTRFALFSTPLANFFDSLTE